MPPRIRPSHGQTQPPVRSPSRRRLANNGGHHRTPPMRDRRRAGTVRLPLPCDRIRVIAPEAARRKPAGAGTTPERNSDLQPRNEARPTLEKGRRSGRGLHRRAYAAPLAGGAAPRVWQRGTGNAIIVPSLGDNGLWRLDHAGRLRAGHDERFRGLGKESAADLVGEPRLEQADQQHEDEDHVPELEAAPALAEGVVERGRVVDVADERGLAEARFQFGDDGGASLLRRLVLGAVGEVRQVRLIRVEVDRKEADLGLLIRPQDGVDPRLDGVDPLEIAGAVAGPRRGGTLVVGLLHPQHALLVGGGWEADDIARPMAELEGQRGLREVFGDRAATRRGSRAGSGSRSSRGRTSRRTAAPRPCRTPCRTIAAGRCWTS